jgi:hypothetical protein
VIPIPFNDEGSKNADWHDAGQTKCCRELHLYVENGKLCCTGFLRIQNATIFPKNVHFFATLLQHVADELGCPPAPQKTHADTRTHRCIGMHPHTHAHTGTVVTGAAWARTHACVRATGMHVRRYFFHLPFRLASGVLLPVYRGVVQRSGVGWAAGCRSGSTRTLYRRYAMTDLLHSARIDRTYKVYDAIAMT